MTRWGRVVALIVLPTCVACLRDHAPRSIVVTSPLRAQIDALRSEANFEAACSLAIKWCGELRRANAAQWQRRDAEREVDTLRRLVAVPGPARAEWRRCWRRVEVTRAEHESDPAAALAALDAWLALLHRWLDHESVEVAAAMAAKALIHEQASDLAWAYDLEREVLRMRVRLHGERHPDVATSLDRLAYVKKRGIGGLDFLEMNQRALEMRRDLLGEDSREYAMSLLRRANYRRLRSQYDAASLDFEAAKRIFVRLDGDSSSAVADVLTDHGLMLGLHGRWEEAERLLRNAVAICRARPETPIVIQSLALNQLGVALRELGRCEEARVVLEQAAKVQEERRRRANPKARHTIYQVTAHRDLALVALCQERWTDAWVSFERASIRNSVEAARSRGDLRPDSDPWDGLLARVQASLPDSTAIVGWVDRVLGGGITADWPYWAYVVRNVGSPKWVRVEAPPHRGTKTMLDNLVYMRNEIETEARWPLRADAPSSALEKLAKEVHALRIAPIEPLLEGVRELVITSPEMNHTFPIEGLVDASGRAVADRFVTSYAQSALLYAVGRERSRKRSNHPWTSLLVGSPFQQDSLSVWRDLHPLQQAAVEIFDLARRLEHADIFTGTRASEAGLDSLRRAGKLEQYDFIHFATHADKGRPSPMWSALLLAEAKRLPEGQWVAAEASLDGRLTVDEILTNWQLSARLVNLAICGGLGTRHAPVDGPTGLGAAFLDAGAQSILVSTVTVDDEASAILFRRFASLYLRADGSHRPTAAAALRDARLWTRDYRMADGSQPFRSPTFWSGYVLIGSPD